MAPALHFPVNYTLIKQQLYRHCFAYTQARINSIEQAIAAARQAAADDTKSSAGDKYETTREMMQQETSRNSAQLAEAGKMNVQLQRIKPDAAPLANIGPGSLVITDQGNFYITVAAGNCIIDGTTYYTISASSPIALAMLKLSSSQNFVYNRKMFVIHQIY